MEVRILSRASNMNFLKNSQKGQLLLEVLVAIAVVAVIVGVGSQVVFVSMKSNKAAGEKNSSQGLSVETFEAVQSAASEKWQNLYNLNKDGTNYYPTSTDGKWAIATGAESIVISGMTYSRSFTVQNVCRDDSTRSITGITDSNGSSTTACTVSGGSPDNSTQKINVSISWPDAEPFSYSQYMSRWRNKVCVQTTWSSQGSGAAACPATTYTSSTNITTSTGGSLEISP